MHLQGMWHEFMAAAGNAPGAQQGDVIVTLLEPVGGVQEVTVPSNDVTIAAEAGNLIGVQLLTPEGRRLFIAAGNLAGMIDAPLSGAGRGRRQDGQPATGGRRPELGPGEIPQEDTRSRDAREADDAELESRIPAANRTDEQAERAREREQAAERGDRQAAQESEREERERTREDDRRAQERDDEDPGDDREAASSARPAAARQRPASRPRAGQDDEAPDAAHDKAEAAHDKSEAAADKAAARRAGR